MPYAVYAYVHAGVKGQLDRKEGDVERHRRGVGGRVEAQAEVDVLERVPLLGILLGEVGVGL